MLTDPQALADKLLQLLQIPSVTGDEAAIALYLHRWAQRCRLPVLRQGNALVIGRPDRRRPCIALVGHTDTVPGHPQDIPPQQLGERIVGLGASDMKGALAVIQQLFEDLPHAELPFALLAIFYDREEGAYADNGLQPLLDGVDMLRQIDLAIVMEPTDNTLQLGCVGSLQATVTFGGQAAHTARPWQGDNAIHKA
ncbi:MAG: M20/M25/M40 family metallo-hydrolase, partial [Deltaproteobacteria bacterium]